jgi:hypothetical protein
MKICLNRKSTLVLGAFLYILYDNIFSLIGNYTRYIFIESNISMYLLMSIVSLLILYMYYFLIIRAKYIMLTPSSLIIVGGLLVLVLAGNYFLNMYLADQVAQKGIDNSSFYFDALLAQKVVWGTQNAILFILAMVYAYHHRKDILNHQ